MSTGDLSLTDHFRRGMSEFDRVEVIFDDDASGGRRATVGSLSEDAERLAGGLQARGIRAGDVVAVQLGSSYEGAVTQAAAVLCGAVLLPVVLIYGPRELDFILRQSGAAALFLPAEVRGRPHAAAVLPRLRRPPALRTVVVVGDAPIYENVVAFHDLRTKFAAPYAPPTLRSEDRAMLVYTSGTTADPKGVQHTHRSLSAAVFSPPMSRQFRQLGLFPAGHIAGLLALGRLIVHGCPTVVLANWDAARAATLVDEHQLTFAAGAPVQLAGLLDERARGTATLASLTEFLTGAATVHPSLIRRADAAGVPAYRSYGSSEYPTVSTGWSTDPLYRRAETDGPVMAGTEVRILDPDGAALPDGEAGEIVLRGPALFRGYTDATHDRDALLPGGWFRTGDVGMLDEGYITIVDRKKDLIIRGGENISPKEVEDVLAEHPAVFETAVIGISDERMGERVCAVVVLAPGSQLGLDEVREHFRSSGLARQKTPERLEIVAELPRTPAGKVQKFVLRQRLDMSVRGATRPASQ